MDRILRKDCTPTYCKHTIGMASAERCTRKTVWGKQTMTIQHRFPEQIIINHSV